MARNPIISTVAAGFLAAGLWFGSAARSNDAKAEAQKATEAEIMELARGNNAFACAMYAQLAKGHDGNLFFSPVSIRSALAMTYAGARGNTARQMKDALRLTLADDRLHRAFQASQDWMNSGDHGSHTLRVANSLWGEKTCPFLEAFLDLNKTCYGSSLNRVDFRGASEPARQAINAWVEERTEEKIRDLIPAGGLNEQARLVLVNAVYFLGSWNSGFDKELTKEETFKLSGDRSVQAAIMQHKSMPELRYLERPGFQALELGYQGDAVSMVVLLPAEIDGLAELERSLKADSLDSWLAALDKQLPDKVRVFLPKFKLKWGTADVGDKLRNLGMTDPFDAGKADFSGMNGLKPPSAEALAIASVFHQAFVDVNEQGTEAAAATAVVMLAMAAPEPPPVFRADHPFLFLIRDKATGSILFMGRVMDPSAG